MHPVMRQRLLPASHVTGLVLLLGFPGALQAQAAADTIRGRVTEAGAAMPGILVVVTVPPGRGTMTARTSATGEYRIIIPDGPGDYLIHFTAMGRKPIRQRLHRPSAGNTLVCDASLVPIVTALERVTVATAALRPQRGAPAGPEPAASEALVEGVDAMLEPSRYGDLLAMASALPGTVPSERGPSVLGVDPSQNSVTVNGLASSATEIPRDAATRTRVTTSTYDPARGGFGGAQIAVELDGGGEYSTRHARLTQDAPAARADRVTAQLGQRARATQFGIGGDGELIPGALYYNLGLQGTHRSSDIASLGSLGTEGAERLGIAPAAMQALGGALAGIPASPGGPSLPSARTQHNYSLVGRLDRTPTARNALALILLGQHSDDNLTGLTPLSALTQALGARSDALTVQGLHSRFVAPRVLTEVRTSLSGRWTRTTPYRDGPRGIVLLPALLADSSEGRVPASFGGTSGRQDANAWTWQVTSETQFYAGRAHKLKLYAESRLDGTREQLVPNPYGAYVFASPADIVTGTPSSYSRTVGVRESDGGEWAGALAIGDQWRATPSLQLLYGLRGEATRFGSVIPENTDVGTALGIHTNAVPGEWHVSPRLGFAWYFAGMTRTPYRTAQSPLGRRTIGPRGMLRGGIGEFRSALPVSLFAPAQIFTGRPDAPRQLRCIGAASPTPEWNVDDGPPVAGCVGTDSVAMAAATAPDVRYFSPSFEAPRSWRGNLAWSSVAGALAFTVDASYSLNMRQASTTDVNFAGQALGALASEANRPLFTAPSAIGPTGLVQAEQSRRIGRYNGVWERGSDGLALARQLMITVAPDLNPGRYRLALTYTLSDARRRANGFDAPTAGNPRSEEWAPSEWDARHQVALQAGIATSRVAVTLYGRLISGLPYTPVVASDINGDGLANDRAMIPSPADDSDPALQKALASLLASRTGSARSCLESQAGAIANRNSCRGPWVAMLNAQAAFKRGDRVRLVVNLANPLAALDQALHGTAGLRGWGAPSAPDPVLFHVRGYDAQAGKYQYVVNPQFGTGARDAAFRNPFRITLDVSVDVGTPFPLQQLQHALAPGRERPGARLGADALRRRYEGNVPDLYAMVIAESDSLLLSPIQVDSLRALRAAYRPRVDSVWADLAAYLSALPAEYPRREAYERQERAVDKAWELTQAEAPLLKAVLSPLQLQLAPTNVRYVVNATARVRLPAFGP